MKFNSYVIERQVKDETKKLDKSIPLEIRLVSRESLFPYNTFVSIINYMHFSFVWSRLTLTTAILFPVEPCPNNVFHIPAFIIGNINVTMGQTILILLVRYRRVAVRASLQRFLTSRIFSSVLFQVNEENLVSVKKEKKKRIVIPLWRLWLFDFNFYFKGFISKSWKTDPNAYRVYIFRKISRKILLFKKYTILYIFEIS